MASFSLSRASHLCLILFSCTNKDYVRAVGLSSDSFARVVAFAISQPEDMDINEIIFRPTAQEL